MKLVIRSEPPGTDPYAGWCGSRRLITSGYWIGLRRLFLKTSKVEVKINLFLTPAIAYRYSRFPEPRKEKFETLQV